MAKPERVRTTDDREQTGDDERERTSECPECGGRVVPDEERGEVACEDCGIILEEGIIDRGPEWRAFNPSDKAEKSRVGAPVTERLHDKGLSSVIGWQDQDARGQTLSPEKREKMSRLRTWDERFRAQDARDRNLKQALSEIERMGSALGLPENVRETASVIYRRALEADLLPGRSIEAMATGALYAAARQAGTPRSLDECAAVSRVDRQEFARAYRYLVGELELAIAPADPESYLPRFISELELSDETERLARELLADAKAAAVHSGKSPIGLTAAAIYAAATLVNEPITQGEIADATDVSEVTIRNRYKELLEAAENPAAPA